MKISRPTKDQLLLEQKPHYVLLAIGAAAVVGSIVTLFTSVQEGLFYLTAGLIWIGFSSGYGNMLFDRSKQTIMMNKWWWTRRTFLLVRFDQVRYGEASRVDRNSYFRLVMVGGGSISLSSSANLINNADEVADAVNDFLGLYPAGKAPPVAVRSIAAAPPPVAAEPIAAVPAVKTLLEKMAVDSALKQELVAHRAELANSEMNKAALAAGGHLPSAEEIRALKAAGQMSRVSLQTTPSGAAISLDGRRCGTTPLVFALPRIGETPRVVSFSKDGYNTVQKHILPDGRDMELDVTLEAI